MASNGYKMKKTPFGALFTPALTSCPPAVSRIGLNIYPKRFSDKLIFYRTSSDSGLGEEMPRRETAWKEVKEATGNFSTTAAFLVLTTLLTEWAKKHVDL